MKYVWKDLPERENHFTVKNAVMIDLNTRKVVRHYCTNTKIAVVQKCITPEKTYYRTENAFRNNLDYAFEAEAFGLQNEEAPLEPAKTFPLDENTTKRKPATETPKPAKKQTVVQKASSPKSGGVARLLNGFRKFFRRHNG